MGQKLTTCLLFSYFVTSCDLKKKSQKKTSQAEDDPMSGTAATLGMMVFGYGCVCVCAIVLRFLGPRKELWDSSASPEQKINNLTKTFLERPKFEV